MELKKSLLLILVNMMFFELAHAIPDICSSLGVNKYTNFADLGPGKRKRGYLCYVVQDNPQFQRVLTLKHTNHRGDWDVLVGTDFNTENKKVYGTIPYTNNRGVTDELLWLPGNSYQTYVVVVFPTSSTPSEACLIQHQFDAGEVAAQALVMATAQSFLKYLFSDENDTQQQSNEKSRVIAGGMSVLQRNNLASVGYDMVLNEISLQLSNAFGGGSWLTTFGVNYFGGYLEQSGKYLFDSSMSCSN